MNGTIYTRRQILATLAGWDKGTNDLPSRGIIGASRDVEIPAQYRDTGHTHARITYQGGIKVLYRLEWVTP